MPFSWNSRLRGTARRLRIPAVLALAAATLWLLRWPLLGGLVRDRLDRLAAEELGASIERAELGGSLLFSVTLRDAVLRPRPGAPFRRLSVERMTVRYGVLGASDPEIQVRGLDVELAPSEGTPVHEQVRDGPAALRKIAFRRRIEVLGSRVTLADGRLVEVDHALVEGSSWSAAGRTAGLGRVSVSGSASPDGPLRIEAAASEGPVREARVKWEGSAVRIEALVLGRRVAWDGTVETDREGRMVRMEGGLPAESGGARAAVDFESGRVRVEVDAREGEWLAAGRLEGILGDPPDRWRVGEILLRGEFARVGGVELDEAEARSPGGTLAALPVDVRLRRGGDGLEARGSLRWTERLEADATFAARAEGTAPYDAPFSARAIVLSGRFLLDSRGPSVEGSLETGEGSVEGFSWAALRAEARVTSERVELRSLAVDGTALGSTVRGTAEIPLGPGAFRVEAGAGTSSFAAEGELGEGSGRVTLSARAAGAAVSGLRAGIRRESGTWRVDVEPVGIDLPGGRRVELDGFAALGGAGRTELPDLGWRLRDPPLEGRLSASVRWDERDILFSLAMRGLRFESSRLADLNVRGSIRQPDAEATLAVDWGREDGDHLLASGRLGRTRDFRLKAAVGDLRSPLIRRLVPGLDLGGELSVDARMSGTASEPRLDGTLKVLDLSVAGMPPFDLLLPVTSERGAVGGEAATPYGPLVLSGTLGDSATPMRVEARVETSDVQAVADFVPPSVRPHLPRGRLAVAAVAESLRIGVEAEFRGDSYLPPSPIGKVTRLHVRARFDDQGLLLEKVEGRLGSGPFHASGRWATGQTGRPLSLKLRGTELLAVEDDLLRLRLNPDIELTHREGEGWRMTGTVELPLLFYYREFAGGSRPSDRRSEGIVAPGLRLAPAEEGGFVLPGVPGWEGLALDLRLRSSGEVRLENSVVGVLLSADLRVRGTAARPCVSGSVLALRGEVKLTAGRFLRIEWATALLPEKPGEEATVRFEGSVGKGQGTIAIVADGPLEAPSLRLSSDPPRTQQEILAFLAFGEWPGALSGSQAAGTVAGKLLDQATDTWPSADRKEGLLDRFQPTVVQENEPRRRAPWELPAGTSRGTVVRAEYFLSRQFSVIAETDSSANVGGELKLRVRF